MQFLLILNILGFLYLFLALTMIFPLVVSFIYGDGCAPAFLYSSIITAISGAFLYWKFPSEKKELSHRDGFLIVTLGWSTVAIFGCLPFIFSGSITSFTFPSEPEMYFMFLSIIRSPRHSFIIIRCFCQLLFSANPPFFFMLQPPTTRIHPDAFH